MGVQGREAVLNEILSLVPEEVKVQVTQLFSSGDAQAAEKKKAKPRPKLKRSTTQSLTFKDLSDLSGSKGLDQMSSQRRTVTLEGQVKDLEAQLSLWMSLAQLLATELGYQDKRVKDWQEEKPQIRAVVRKFREQIKHLKAPDASPRVLGGADDPEKVSIPTSAAGISMLVVTPDVAEANQLVQHCTDSGYQVTPAASGEAALEKVREVASQGGRVQPYELVLCDAELPDMPGLELLLELREILGNNVTIIMMSGASSEHSDMVERCIVDGADSYMPKPPLKKELAALWGFVARRRQQSLENAKRESDLNQAIRSVEAEIGEHVRRKTEPSIEDTSFAQGRKSVTWHEQFSADFKADLEHAQLDKLSSKAASRSSAIAANPNVQTVIHSSATSLLGALAANRKRKKDPLLPNDPPVCSHASGVGCSVAGCSAVSDTASGGGGGVKGKLPPGPAGRVLRKGDSGNLRAMLLQRRRSSSGRSSKDVMTMLALLEGGEDEDDEGGAPDEMVLCRLCEEQVLRSSLKLHTAMCRAQHRSNEEDEALNKEVAVLLQLLQSSQNEAMHALIAMAVQRHDLLCAPLNQMSQLCDRVTSAGKQGLSPLHLIGCYTEFARELTQLRKAEESTLKEPLFYSCASQLKGILAQKIAHVQQLIDLDPQAIDAEDGQPVFSRINGATGKLGIKDFALQRILATGGFAQVWLAKKKSTGDVMAIKAMRKDQLRQMSQVASINVEHAILGRHDCEYLVRAFYSFRSAHHIYFALEFMPGGDLSSMLEECGCVSESHSAFYLAEILLGLQYLHSQHILHRDIKPSNVLIGASGHIKLADFGLSTSMIVKKRSGTLPYVAPEVLRDQSGDEGVDYWSVGILLHELLVGSVPWAGDTPAQMLAAIESKPITSDGFSPVALSLTRALLTVDPSLRLGVQGFDEIQSHAYFAFTRWDAMHEVAPPFVPQLASDGDDSYFPNPMIGGGEAINSDSEDDSDSESFKMIRGANVDQLLKLTRPSKRRSTPPPSNESSLKSITTTDTSSERTATTATTASPISHPKQRRPASRVDLGYPLAHPTNPPRGSVLERSNRAGGGAKSAVQIGPPVRSGRGARVGASTGSWDASRPQSSSWELGRQPHAVAVDGLG